MPDPNANTPNNLPSPQGEPPIGTPSSFPGVVPGTGPTLRPVPDAPRDRGELRERLTPPPEPRLRGEAPAIPEPKAAQLPTADLVAAKVAGKPTSTDALKSVVGESPLAAEKAVTLGSSSDWAKRSSHPSNVTLSQLIYAGMDPQEVIPLTKDDA